MFGGHDVKDCTRCDVVALEVSRWLRGKQSAAKASPCRDSKYK
jgi:hypothetical protein